MLSATRNLDAKRTLGRKEFLLMEELFTILWKLSTLGWLGGALAKGALVLFIGIIGSVWNLVGFLTNQEHSLGWLGGALAKGALLLFIGIIGSVWNLVGFLTSQEHSRESYIMFIYKSIFKNTQGDSPSFSSLPQMCRGVQTSLGPSRSF